MHINKLISIIIPIYNMGKYLDECIHSVAVQTYANIEIILIDDGSIDNSETICSEWRKKDSRIRYVKKPKRGGVSSARNLGLKQATGDYIAFVDADDWIAPNMYESLLKLLTKNKADLAICGRTRVVNGKEIHYPQTKILHFYNGRIDMRLLSCQFDLNILANKLYSRKLLEDLQLPESMSYAEDLYVAPDILNRSKHAVYTSEGYYYYRENLSSASFHLTEEKLQSDIIAKEKFYRFMKSKKVNTSIAFDFLFGAYVRGYEQGKPKKEFIRKYIRFYCHNWAVCLPKLKCLIFLLSPALYLKLKK